MERSVLMRNIICLAISSQKWLYTSQNPSRPHPSLCSLVGVGENRSVLITAWGLFCCWEFRTFPSFFYLTSERSEKIRQNKTSDSESLEFSIIKVLAPCPPSLSALSLRFSFAHHPFNLPSLLSDLVTIVFSTGYYWILVITWNNNPIEKIFYF